MSQRLILVRGLPGSGKTTYAKSLKAVHIETDNYFVDQAGNYCFDPSELTAAHQWCFEEVIKNLLAGNDVVVANTFVQFWEMKPYIELANEKGYKLEIVCCVGKFKNKHGVSNNTLLKMESRWEECQWLTQVRHQPLE